MISLWLSAGQLVTVGAQLVMVAVTVSKMVAVIGSSEVVEVMVLLDHSRRSGRAWALTPAATAAAIANLVNMFVMRTIVELV